MTNITFGFALIIILIILPGGVFRRAYLSSEFSNYHLRASNFSEIVFTIGVGVLFQCLGLIFENLFISKYYVDFEIIGKLLTAPDPNTFVSIGKSITQIFLYSFLLCAFCFLTGRISMYIILTRRIDEKMLIFKFDNEWNYIFSGKSFARKKEDEIYKYVNVCVSIDDTFVVYTGFLTNYWLGKEGQLEMVELKKVKRKIINRSCESLEGEMQKPTHTEYHFNISKLLIPYSQIQNLSITYYDLEEIPS